MPEDDGSLEERLLSIAEWSRGFLSGFTQGITLKEAAGEPIPTMTAEALKDMAVIAQVDTEESDSEDAEITRWIEPGSSSHYRVRNQRVARARRQARHLG